MSENPEEVKTYKDAEEMAQDHRLGQYDRIVVKAKATFEERNEMYGDAIAETGVLGAVVALVGDVGRMKKLVLRNPTAGQDVSVDVVDTLIDVLNQAVIALMMYSDKNWRGK